MRAKLKGFASVAPIIGITAILPLPALSAAADSQTKSDIPAQSPILPLAEAPTALPYTADIADELGDSAVAANPSLRAIQERVGALEQRVRVAGAWLDPTFSAEYSSMPIVNPVPGQHPMSGIQFVLKQTFYWPGKIRTRKEEAEHRVQLEQLSLAEQQVQLRATVKRAYYRLALSRQLREITQRHMQLVSDFIDVVRVKVEVGSGAQHEYLRLRVLADQLKDDVEDFAGEDASLTAVINATLHRSLDTPVSTPEQTPVIAPTMDATALARKAERERPLLKRLSAEAETYHAAARRAGREGYPDITLWAGYRVRTQAGTDPGTDFVSVGVSLPLPISYDARWGSEKRQNEKMAEAALQDRAASIDGIRGDLGRIIAEWKRAAQQARTYRDELVPEARLSLDATFASYRVNRADFASLFQAELQLLNFERTIRMAEARAAEARVNADAIVGSGVR